MNENLSIRAARTRSALLQAGLVLMAERPVDAIAIDELVAAAGVAKGSFFNHFRDKAHFARSVVREIRLEVEQWVSRTNDGISDPLQRLAGGMIASAAYAMHRPDRARVLVGAYGDLSLKDHPLNAGLLHDIQDAAAQGQISLPSEEAGVLFWLGSCQGLMASILRQPAGEIAHVHLVQALLQMKLRGLGAVEERIAEVTEPDWIRDRLARALAAAG